MHSRMNPQNDYIIRGGWPNNQDLPLEQAALLPKEYISAILNDDIERIDGVKLGERAVHTLDRVGQPIHEVA